MFTSIHTLKDVHVLISSPREPLFKRLLISLSLFKRSAIKIKMLPQLGSILYEQIHI